jgi:CDP-6-deoxy-D-xylo-4-hexulose-3-dehydrase
MTTSASASAGAAIGVAADVPAGSRRIDYAGSVHDEREIEAVVEVLRGGPTALRIGKNVLAMEQRVAELFGKRRGVMCNSGSSALYLAIEVLGLEPGDEIITSAVTFSTDIAPMMRAGLVPAFVDVTPDTFQIDVEAIEAMIGPRTRAILAPNLIGNAPDWDRIREIADRHGLKVVEDSCDALGLTLRGTPTGTRADISLTSFALSHIITAAGTGGMVCFDDDELADQALLLRRWGRRSEVQLFGSRKGVERRFFSTLDDDDALEYDNLFIFDELGWNFEPSELSAAFGLVQLDKLGDNLKRRQRSFELTSSHFAKWPQHFTLPRLTEGVETGWHMFPVLINRESGIRRSELQQWMESHGVDTRMVWTGNAARQPAFRHRPFRAPASGLPNADRVMEWGIILPNSHSMTDDDCAYIGETVDAFVKAMRS